MRAPSPRCHASLIILRKQGLCLAVVSGGGINKINVCGAASPPRCHASVIILRKQGLYLAVVCQKWAAHPWQKDLFLGDPFAIEDGKIQIPSEPGWGVEINPTWLAKATRQVSTL